MLGLINAISAKGIAGKEKGQHLLTFALIILDLKVGIVPGQKRNNGIITQLSSYHDCSAAPLILDVRVCSKGQEKSGHVWKATVDHSG